MTLQEICDAIWTYETRVLKPSGEWGVSETYLDEICYAGWHETTRTLATTNEVVFSYDAFLPNFLSLGKLEC